MNKLTLERLSILLKKERNILSFIYNDLFITILPPFRRMNGYDYDYKYSIYVENIDQDGLKDNELLNRWKPENTSKFKAELNKMLYYHIFPKDNDFKNSLLLKDYLIKVESQREYLNKFNIIFNDKVGDVSFEVYELTEDRAKHYISSSRMMNRSIIFKDIRVLNKSKKRLSII
jgi:hypothetical protein